MRMFTEEEIQEIVKQKIETDEQLGNRAGGSGHLGFKSYVLNGVKTKQLTDNQLEIRYSYTVYVETEFTYYPDNPPMEYSHTCVVVVDTNKNILT